MKGSCHRPPAGFTVAGDETARPARAGVLRPTAAGRGAASTARAGLVVGVGSLYSEYKSKQSPLSNKRSTLKRHKSAMAVSALLVQQLWTIAQHDGPNHLELWFKSGDGHRPGAAACGAGWRGREPAARSGRSGERSASVSNSPGQLAGGVRASVRVCT